MGRRAFMLTLLSVALTVGVLTTSIPQAISRQENQAAKPPPLQTTATAQEILFLDEMHAHHLHALFICRLVVSRSADPTLSNIAATVIDSETPELTIVDIWLAASALDIHIGTSPNGIATASQLRELQKSEGTDFDRTAAVLLLSNQRASYELARLSSKGAVGQVGALAKKIAERQSAIVEQLAAWVGANAN